MENICAVKIIFYTDDKQQLLKLKKFLSSKSNKIPPNFVFWYSNEYLNNTKYQCTCCINGNCKQFFDLRFLKYISKNIGIKFAFIEIEPMLNLYNCYDPEQLFFKECCSLFILEQVFGDRLDSENRIISSYRQIADSYSDALSKIKEYCNISTNSIENISIDSIAKAKIRYHNRIYENNRKRIYDIYIHKFSHID